MEIWEILLIALGLAMDCFAVSLGIGTSAVEKTLAHGLRLSFHFGLFQGLMALLDGLPEPASLILFPMLITGWRFRSCCGLAGAW